MAKRLTENQKQEIIQSFTEGVNIDILSQKYDCTKLTITRNLKKKLGLVKYKELNINSKKENAKNYRSENKSFISDANKEFKNSNLSKTNKSLETKKDNFYSDIPFLEITPLNCEIENISRKEFASVPLNEVDFPKILYMIVDSKIELEVKSLKDYPNWSFLPADDLNRKTLEIYSDLKIAKRFCKKDQKVLKIPNPDVFRIAAPILIAKGISRIVNSDKLIAL